jgi:parallel beta-helix repeat protein
MTIAIRRHALPSLVAAAVTLSLGAETRAANELCGQTITESITLTADQSCTDDGLIVGADGITIDLGGFTLSGDGGASDDGIDVNGHAKVTIRNGTVRNFQRGITSTAGIAPQKLKISRMTLRYNVKGGALTVESGVIEQSAFSNSTDVGLDVGISAGKITATDFVANGGDGLTLFAGKVTVTNVIASGNVGSGIHVMPGQGLAIQSSTCADNVVNGILVEGPYDPIKIVKNTLVGNGANGVAFISAGSAGGGNKIAGNFIAGNGASGVALAGFADGNLVSGNRLVGNDDDGVTVDSTSSANVVKRNTAIGNGGEGFSIGHASTVVAGNVGNANHDRGILAIGGAVDGGGNKGRANGGPPCSTGIACAPAFTPKAGPDTVTCGMAVTTSITLGADRVR